MNKIGVSVAVGVLFCMFIVLPYALMRADSNKRNKRHKRNKYSNQIIRNAFHVVDGDKEVDEVYKKRAEK